MNEEPQKLRPERKEAFPVKDLVVPERLTSEEKAAALKPELTPTEAKFLSDEKEQIEGDQRKDRVALELETLRLQNKSLAEDIEARRTYAGRIFALICWWLIAVLLIVTLHGFLSKSGTRLEVSLRNLHWKSAAHFELPTSVLLALVGGTTATVLGLFVIVANYFFPKRFASNSIQSSKQK